jgi:hypothetical protein
MNLLKAGGTAAQAAFQASSYRGMHTTPRRDSLMVKRWLKRASETITRKAGNSNSGKDLTAFQCVMFNVQCSMLSAQKCRMLRVDH